MVFVFVHASNFYYEAFIKTLESFLFMLNIFLVAFWNWCFKRVPLWILCILCSPFQDGFHKCFIFIIILHKTIRKWRTVLTRGNFKYIPRSFLFCFQYFITHLSPRTVTSCRRFCKLMRKQLLQDNEI